MFENPRSNDSPVRMKFEKRISIKTKMTVGMGILGLMLLLGIGFVMFFISRDRLIDNHSILAYSYTGTGARFIDGDSIAGYLETLEKDDYYEFVEDYINAALSETDLIHFSVFVPLEDQQVFIWDGMNDNEPGLELGFRTDYFKGQKSAVDEIYRPDPPENVYSFTTTNHGEVLAAFSPILNSNNEPVAVVEAIIALNLVTLKLTSIMRAITLMFVIVIGALSVYGFILARTILGPIRELSRASGDLVDNLKDGQPFRTDIRTGDEIEGLAHSFEEMDAELRAYLKENTSITAEKERIGTELSLAARIQKDMLPGVFPAFPEKTEIDIYASMTPAREVGGDFYDFFLIDDRHIALVMADVSGKGIPAALFMMKSMIMLRNSAMSGNGPKAVLEEVNNELCRNNQEKMFVTVWFGILDLDSGIITAANGGHEYPIFRKPDGPFEIIKDKHGFVLGGIPGMRYMEYELRMDPGACLFVYTDGVPEANDKNDQLFGMERTVAALNRQPDGSPRDLLNNIRLAVADFVQDVPQFDDLTMMAVKYKGRQGENNGDNGNIEEKDVMP